MRSNYNSAVQADDKCSAADEFSVADNCFYYGYLSYADCMIVFDTIVSSVGLQTPFKKSEKGLYQVRCSASPGFGLLYVLC